MAKNQAKQDSEVESAAGAAEPVAVTPTPFGPAAGQANAVADAPVRTGRKRLFLVKCNAQTYLAHNPAVIEVTDGDNAWQMFMEMNGISGCEHGHETTEITEAEAAEHRQAIAEEAAKRAEKKKIRTPL